MSTRFLLVLLSEEVKQGKIPTKEPLVMQAKSKHSNPAVFRTCEACNVLCVYQIEWDAHCSSRKHHKRLASIKKQETRLANARLELSQTLTRYEAVMADASLYSADNDS